MSLYEQAIERFNHLLARAQDGGLNEPTAVNLATVGLDGRPSSRVVLLKGADEQGFTFYTNTTSRKAEELARTPYGALCFFWDPLMEQVRVEGSVTPVGDEQADQYWATRHEESQLGAWASSQSGVLDSRATLERKVAEYREKFAGGPIPRPPFWSGYCLLPDRLEFWRALPHRLNERLCYRLVDGEWSVSLLYP